eukprot:jgi/Galph1/651/GphlegSOOS_G5380.1
MHSETAKRVTQENSVFKKSSEPREEVRSGEYLVKNSKQIDFSKPFPGKSQEDSLSLTFGSFEPEVETTSSANVSFSKKEEQTGETKKVDRQERVNPLGPQAVTSGNSSPPETRQNQYSGYTPSVIPHKGSPSSSIKTSPGQTAGTDKGLAGSQVLSGVYNIPKDMQRTSSAPPNPAEVGKLPPFLPDRFQHYSMRNAFLPYGATNVSYGQPNATSLSVPFGYGGPTAQEHVMFGQNVPQGVGYPVYGTNQHPAYLNQNSYSQYTAANPPMYDNSQRNTASTAKPVSPPYVSSGVVVPPKREKKRIPIIDPNTKQEIDLSATSLEKAKKQSSASSSPLSTSSHLEKTKEPKSKIETEKSVEPLNISNETKLKPDTSTTPEQQSNASLEPLKQASDANSKQDSVSSVEKESTLLNGVPKSSSMGGLETQESIPESQQSNKPIHMVVTREENKNIEDVVSVKVQPAPVDVSASNMTTGEDLETVLEQKESVNKAESNSLTEDKVLATSKKEQEECFDTNEVLSRNVDTTESFKDVPVEETNAKQKPSEQVVSPRRERFVVRGGKAITSRQHSYRDTDLAFKVDGSNILDSSTEQPATFEGMETKSTPIDRRQYTLDILLESKTSGSLVSFDEKTQEDIRVLNQLNRNSHSTKKSAGFDNNKLSRNMFPGSNISGPPPGFSSKTGKDGKDAFDLGKARSRNVPIPNSSSSSNKNRSYGGKELSDLRGTKVAAPDMHLIQAAQAWKHRRDDEDEYMKKMHTVRSILNKLTYEKFDRLYEQILDVKIDSPEILRGIVSEIFDKALLEPNFGPMYAELCARLASDMQKMLEESAEDGFRDESGKKVTFKGILLSNCQNEFQKFAKCENSSQQGENVAKEKEEAEGVNKSDSNSNTVDEEEERIRLKRRMIGNIKFIGELFKKDMILERIIRDECIPRLASISLVPNPDEDDVESLCKLLTSVGAKLDSRPENRTILDQYFEKLDRFRTAVKLPSRIRFMIMDLHDLRKNNWVERRQEAQAKTIGEIHAEVQREEKEKAQASRERDRTSTARDRRTGSAYTPRMTMHMGTSSPRSSGFNQRVEANWEKFAGRKQDFREYADKVELGPVRLGPSSGIMAMAGGARGWKTVHGTSDSQKTSESGNAGEIRPKSILSHSAQTSTDAVEHLSIEVSDSSSKGEEGVNDVENVQEEALSSEVFGRRLKSILEEYHSLKDVHEAEESLKEIPKANLDSFVLQFVQVALETKTSVRRDAVSLFSISRKILSPDIVKNGICLVLELLDELDIDDPHASEFVASLVGRAAALGMLEEVGQESPSFGLTFLRNELQKIGDPSRQLKFVVLVFSELKEALSEMKNADSVALVLDALKKCDVSLKEIAEKVASTNRDECLCSILKKHASTFLCLELVLKRALEHSEVNEGESISKHFLNLMEEFDDTVRNSEELTKVLGTFYFSAIDNQCSVSSDMERQKLLVQEKTCEKTLANLISDDYEKQLTLLVHAQKFCHERGFPFVLAANGEEKDKEDRKQVAMVRLLFDKLYSCGIVSSEAFWNWKEDLTITQQAGKGQALIQMNEWFSHLPSTVSGNSDDEESTPEC